MELNFGGLIGAPVADQDADEDRLVAVLMGMQEGINTLTEVLAEHKARIDALERENRLLRARTDPPKRASIVLPH